MGLLPPVSANEALTRPAGGQVSGWLVRVP